MSGPAPPQPQPHDALEQMLAEQRALTQLGLQDLVARWRQQPDRQFLSVGEGQPPEQTIKGFPEDNFRGVAVVNTTSHAIALGFEAGGGVGSPLVVPAHSFLVWPVVFTNLSIASDTTKPTETLVVLRLRYPPAQPALTTLPVERETWSEEESATAATATLRVPGVKGKKIVVTSIVAQVTAIGAIAAEKVLEGVIKRGANIIFRFNLTQPKTAAAGAVNTFASGPINLTLAEGEELQVVLTGAEANASVILDASGYFA